MQTSFITALKTINAPADTVASQQGAELNLAAPIELDAETLRHVGGGTEEQTPVVSW